MNIRKFVVSLLTLIGIVGIATTLFILAAGILMYIKSINSGIIHIPYIDPKRFLDVRALGIAIMAIIVWLYSFSSLLRSRKNTLSVQNRKFATEYNKHATQITAYGIFYVCLASFLSILITTALFSTIYRPLMLAISVSTPVFVYNILSQWLSLRIWSRRYEPIYLTFLEHGEMNTSAVVKRTLMTFTLTFAILTIAYISGSVK